MGFVSSADGQNFFAPTALNSNGTYSTFGAVSVCSEGKWVNNVTDKTPYSNQYVNYLRYGIKVTAPKEEVARVLKYELKVTDISEHDSTKLLKNAYRVSLADSAVGYATSTNTVIYSDAGTKKTGIISTSSATPGSVNGVTAEAIANATHTYTTTDDNYNTGSTNGVVAYYVASIWVEGTDSDATNDISGSSLKASFTFSLEN